MNQNSKLLYLALVVSMAGFLFGFDTVVINGAEQTLDKLWGDYKLFGKHGLFHGQIVVGSALFGTIFGALFGNIPNDRLGRKRTLVLIGILYTISAIGSGFANDPWIFAFFRFIGGLGVGASTIAAPAFISEIAPAERRGQLVAMYQFNIVFGILVAFISNMLINNNVAVDAWRWMIGIEALPAIIYTFLAMRLPHSPRWLITAVNKVEESRKVLSNLYSETEANEIIQTIVSHEEKASKTENVWMKKYSFPVTLAIAIAAFNQFSGINAFLYYTKRIFETAGLEDSASLLASIGVGVVNLVFTLLGMFLIDRMGRKKLMYIGSVGYIVSLAVVAMAFHFGWKGMIVPISFFAFIAAHAIGQGAVIWVFISEIFPNHVRSAGQSIGTSTHWILAWIIPASVPFLINAVGASALFGFFAFMMVLQLLWVAFVMPETKGVPLEELEERLIRE